MHKIIELYLKGELDKKDLASYYLENFRKEVKGYAPSRDIFKTYFEQGLNYLLHIDRFPYQLPLCVEEQLDFNIEDKKFTGIIDCIAKDDGLIIVDNKSRTLKPRSKRNKPTKSDEELDAYLRQLYLYSIPVKSTFHTYPARLEFNCFRTGELISEPFSEEKFEEAKQWALKMIDTITDNEDWSPKMDYWKCRYICDFSDSCEYFQMNRK